MNAAFQPLPDAGHLVHATGLPASSHLQRVLNSELHRVRTIHLPPPAPRTALSEPGPFERALRASRQGRGGAVIAEYKQGSPSLGPFAAGTPLLDQLGHYREGGAACLSILTEPTFFLGHSSHLEEARELRLPMLYKGFVISEAQLLEAAACGASAVLLIARVLGAHTRDFAARARDLGLEPLVELHDLTEVPFAKGAAARLVGINARDLATFTLGAPTAAPLRESLPEAVLIRESGIVTPEDGAAALRAGFDAVLIGEALMRSADPAGFLRRLFASLKHEAAS
ncbi:MAG TPA: indole-3-glycerol-phosphate synthase [Holophagaceae bacterium]|nr:indole-3-glycerol-phosphate synthase [Holophagaceae bacterium]